ncbi:MAG: tetratricopeptide repeat protein [Bacteroidota bacterium]|nr:tetratricopeptide repeat protein [Bacteroidota bacterium]
MEKSSKFILLFGAVFLALHLWGAISPSHLNWGFHFFAFYKPVFSVFVLIVAILFFIPTVQEKFIHYINHLSQKIKRTFPKGFFLILTLMGLVSATFLLPVKVHLLGDGALLLREISGVQLGDQLPPTFNRQLLAGFLLQAMKSVFQSGTLENSELIFRIVGGISGLVFILIIFALLKLIEKPVSEKFMLGVFIFISAGSQLFFGYAETYAILFVTTAAYLTACWFTLEKKSNILLPILLFIVLTGLHIGSIVLLPGLLLVMYYGWRHQRIETLIIILFSLMLSVIFSLIYYNKLEEIILRTISESQWNFLQLFKSDNYFAYSIFSWAHLIDWGNANLLIAPFGIVLTFVLLIFYRKIFDWKNKVFLFLLTSTVFGLLFTFITFFALGMARDWDFMASFFLPLGFLNIYLFAKSNYSIHNTRVFSLIVALNFLHWGAWIGVNADENRSLNRVKLLNDPYLLGHVPRLNFYENLGSYYWAQKNYVEARNYFEQYTEIDSSNPRILGNLSAIYTKLNQNDRNFWALKRAADVNSPNPAVYINLGIEYSKRGDASTAILLYQKALAMDSTRAKAYANLGSLYMKNNEIKLAAENYYKAILFGLVDSVLYRETGTAFYLIGEYEKSLLMYNNYLKMAPHDEKIKNIRDKLSELIRESKAQK